MLSEKIISRNVITLLVALSFSLIFSMTASSAVPALNCSSTCTTSYCFCSTNCTTGYFNLYTTSDCSGIAKKKVGYDNGTFGFVPIAQTTYGKILCADGNVSSCYILNLTQATTTTTTLTTTTSKTTTMTPAPCPYDCCVNLPGYQSKFCSSNWICQNNACVSTKSDCPNECCVSDPNYNDRFCADSSVTCINGKCVSPGPNISYSLIGIIAIIIVVGVVVFYFLRYKFTGHKNEVGDAYEALKKKWSGG